MHKSKIDIYKVAKLANLPQSSEETDKYSSQLSKVIDYIQQLAKVDTKGVVPTYNVTGLESVWREDKAYPSLEQSQAIKNASGERQGQFVTKGVFEEE